MPSLTSCRRGAPRLLFKGGTSLSKGFGLISRFSEDIDVTVFRDDLVADADIEQLNALGNRQPSRICGQASRHLKRR